MLLYTEEAATEEECISKISRIHRLEKDDFNERVKIIKVRRMTRAAFLGIVKKNVVEITYLFTPRPASQQAPEKKREYEPSLYSYPAGQASSAYTPKLSAHAAGQVLNPPSLESDFAEKKRKLLYSVFMENPDIRERISAEAPSAQGGQGLGNEKGLNIEPEQKQVASSPSISSIISGASIAGDSAARDSIAGDALADPAEKKEGTQGYNFQLYDRQAEEFFGSGNEGSSGKKKAEEPKALSGEMNALLQEVRKIGKRIDMTAGIGKAGSDEHRNISRLMDILELNDFAPSFINKIREKICNELTIEALSDFDYLQMRVLSWMGSCIRIATEHSVTRPRIIALVGPTGTGKTTTVAKLAAAYIRAYKKAPRPLNVRVITIDNYRIGARQHLEKYGEIMGVTVSAAETPQDLHKLVAFYQDADIILVDTTGRSPKDQGEIAGMSAFFTGLQNRCETLLAVSACTKASDLHDIIRQYGIFSLDSLVVTKFDETSRVGNIISMLAGETLPISYITTGQRVPKDFEPASVMKFLLALEGFSINILALRQEFPDPEKRFEWS